MHNALSTTWRQLDAAPSHEESAESPHGRLVWLGGVLIALLAVIGGRLAYVQCVLPEGLIEVFDQTTESFEEIPARDGRILSADGVTLADNEESYDLLVYYRWIEDPPAPDWLKHQARKRLSRSERKNAERLVKAESDVLQRQRDLWQSLSELTQISMDDLSRKRTRIRQRVETIWNRAEARRSGRSTEEEPAGETFTSKPANILKDKWTRFWKEITTPPPRSALDPLVISEQEDDHAVWEGLDADVASEIETHPERYPGCRVVLRSHRVYPQRDLAAHLIGSRTPLQPEELAERQSSLADAEDLRPGDTIGRGGLERSYDSSLRGRRGLRRIVRNRRREIVETEIVREPRSGEDLVLTFDTTLQRRTEELLDRVLVQQPKATSKPAVDDESNRAEPAVMVGPRGACIVALDVRTGAVLAAAAAPRFDLNLLVHSDEAAWQALLDDPRRPMFPRVTQMALPPGSIFKTLSAIALVADGDLDPKARFVCQGFLDRPDKDRCLVFRHYGVGHNDTDLADALCRSCNVYFFTAARHAGPKPLVEWSHKLGIGQPTGIDLPGEAAGALPSPDNKNSRRKWYPGDTLGLVIGQSSLLVTPLQMARLMAAVANDGQLVTPHLAASTGQVHHDASESSGRSRLADAELGTHSSHFTRPEPKPISGLSSDILSVVREGLERVVQDRHGTAYKTVRLPNVKIAGKTGTAEVGSRLPDHAWFAGYVPADEPRVAFVVVIEHGGSGGKVAGPVAKDFVKALLDLGVIHGSSALAKE